MRWDRRLTSFAVFALIVILAAAGALLWFTHLRMVAASERIAGEAREGYEHLMERLERTDNVFRVNVNRRGRFEMQQKYRGFRAAWLRQLVYVPGEYLDEEVEYSHTISFRLKSYDTENVYSHRDAPVAYTRYDDTAALMKSGELYYVTYLEGATEYHFIVSCPAMTEWLEGIE